MIVCVCIRRNRGDWSLATKKQVWILLVVYKQLSMHSGVPGTFLHLLHLLYTVFEYG